MLAYSKGMAIWCLASALPMAAQVQNRQQDWMTWDGAQVAIIDSRPSMVLHFESLERQGASVAHLNAPEGCYSMDYKEHAAWASVKGPSDRLKTTYLYRSVDLKTWQVNATYLGEQGRANAIYHLDGKRYLLVSGPSFFQVNHAFSPYAIAEINEKGFLVLKDLIDLDLKDSLVVSTLPQHGSVQAIGEWNPKYSALLGMLFLNPMIRYPGGMALVAKRPGYIWLFDDQTGAVKRSVKLFSTVTEEKLGPPHRLEWAILGCQPRPDGHLLIASRDESAVLAAMDAFPTNKNLKYLDDEAQQKVNLEQDKANLLRWPQIHWWDLDPATGKITEEPAPQNVPDQIWDLNVFRNFRFRFRPDGNLLVN